MAQAGVPQEKIDKMRELKAQGLSLAQIGKEVGYSATAVYHHTQGVKVPDEKLTPAQRAGIKRWARETAAKSAPKPEPKPEPSQGGTTQLKRRIMEFLAKGEVMSVEAIRTAIQPQYPDRRLMKSDVAASLVSLKNLGWAKYEVKRSGHPDATDPRAGGSGRDTFSHDAWTRIRLTSQGWQELGLKEPVSNNGAEYRAYGQARPGAVSSTPQTSQEPRSAGTPAPVAPSSTPAPVTPHSGAYPLLSALILRKNKVETAARLLREANMTEEADLVAAGIKYTDFEAEVLQFMKDKGVLP